VACRPLSRSSGTPFVTIATMQATTSDSARFSIQKRGLRRPSAKLSPGSFGRSVPAWPGTAAGCTRAGSFIQASTSGSTRPTGSAAISQNAACQFQRVITALTAEGTSIAASPVPDSTSANARPRLRSNQRLTR